jgi:hypothetical protein
MRQFFVKLLVLVIVLLAVQIAVKAIAAEIRGGIQLPPSISIPVEKTKVGHYRLGEQSYDVFIVAEPTTRPYGQ